MAFAIAFSACHRGEIAGIGASCTEGLNPCRAFLACVEGQCQQIADTAPNTHDSGWNDLDGGDDGGDADGPGVTPDGSESPTERPDADEPDTIGQPDVPAADSMEPTDTQPRPDGATDDSHPPQCDRNRAFGPAVLVEGLGPAGISNFIPRLSPDELEIFFTSLRDGTKEIYRGARTSPDAPFTAVAKIAALDSGDYDVAATVSSDLLTMYFETFRTGTFSIHVTTRSTSDGTWFIPVVVVGLIPGRGAGDGGPYVLPDGNTIYFHTNRVGDGRLHIFRSTRGPAGGWSEPYLAMGLTSHSEDLPVVSPDDLTLYYASNTPDGAQGDSDIWMAIRASRDALFSDAVNIASVNTASREKPGWISPDGCRLYFHREDAAGSRVFVASRPLEP